MKVKKIIPAPLSIMIIISSIVVFSIIMHGCKVKSTDILNENKTDSTAATTPAGDTATNQEGESTTAPTSEAAKPTGETTTTPSSQATATPAAPVPTSGAFSRSRIEVGLKNIIVNPSNDKSALTTSAARYDKIDFNSRFFRPKYNTKVELYVSSLPQKPSVKPVSAIVKSPPQTGGNVSKYLKSAFVDNSSNTVRWFSFIKDPSIKPAKYIWQVSLSPFKGSGGDQINPKGLLSSGEIAASSNEFSIDFSKATSISRLAINNKLSSAVLNRNLVLSAAAFGAPPVQKTYYARVIPIDNRGKIIGDGGTGIEIIYGKPYTKALPIKQIAFKFDLQSTFHQGEPTFKELPNSFSYAEKRFLNTISGSQYYCFLPVGYTKDATSLVLQVSKAAFPSSDWETTPGLVYEKRLNSGDEAFNKLSKFDPIKVDFTLFAPPNSKLNNNEIINYYVRVIALKPGKDAGTVNAYYSKTVTIEYGRSEAAPPKIFENKKIDAKLPQILKYSYKPISWETSDWTYRYVVVRQPLENEIFIGFGSDKPYAPFKVGTKLDFTPHPEDKSWWEEAIDAVSDFFGDIAGFAADLTNWVASTYNNLKSGLIEFVAKNLPLVPDSLRDELQAALEGLVDYGLASIGIPPTLPNFDDLTSMGTDYLATLAMETAGVPANDYLKDGLVDLSKGIAGGMDSSTSSGGPNPFGWNFIKSDPDFMYKPAYVLVELYNPHSVPTPQGYITGYNEFIINTSKKTLTSTEQYLYAAFGGNVYYRTFKPISGQKIPSLAPKQKLVIPIFLEEHIGESLWSDGPKVSKNEFKMIYNGLGKFDFNFSFNFQLPPAYEAAKAQKLPPDAIYSYNSTSTGFHFLVEPYKAYSK